MFELFPRLAVTCLLVLSSASAWADGTVRGRVISVAGGDVMTLIDSQQQEHKVRLAHVDVPELGQPFGDEAQSALAAMVLNREVVAKLLGQDAQGNTQAEVVEPKGHLVNLELVKRGLAWHDTFDKQAAAERDRYQAALEEAQRDRRGMWSLDRVEPPRDYRARVERFMRWWLYVVAFLAAFAVLGLIFTVFHKRIETWLAKQQELEKSSAEAYRLAQVASAEEEAERERTRAIADAEMNRLANERRQAAKELASQETRT